MCVYFNSNNYAPAWPSWVFLYRSSGMNMTREIMTKRPETLPYTPHARRDNCETTRWRTRTWLDAAKPVPIVVPSQASTCTPSILTVISSIPLHPTTQQMATNNEYAHIPFTKHSTKAHNYTRYLGVTPPISVNESSAREKEVSQTLMEELRRQGVFESEEESRTR